MKRIKNKYVRRALLAGIVVIGFSAAWFILNRVTAPLRAVKLREAPDAASSTRPFTGRLRIATYNIAHGRGTATSNWQHGGRAALLARLDAIAELLRQQKLDIVVLQEVDFASAWSYHINQGEHIARQAQFPFRVEQRNLDTALPLFSLRFGNVLLSRYPIRDPRRIPFPGYSAVETTLAGKKESLLATVDLDPSRSIRILNVHLEHRSEPVRTLAARRIIDIPRSNSLPLILAGDFNSKPADFPRATLDPDGRTALSELLATGPWQTLPTSLPESTDLTFSSTRPKTVIDWILLPPEWRIISKTVIQTQLSDHMPVVMEVQLDGEQ